jgi:two-component system response regulator RegA
MKRLLLVEDDDSNRITLSLLLEDEGFGVDAAESFAAAAARLASAETPYDAVLLDQHLGDGTGSALLPMVRAQMPSAKALLISGTIVEGAPAPLGFDASMPKGNAFPDVLALLLATLAGEGRGAGSPPQAG